MPLEESGPPGEMHSRWAEEFDRRSRERKMRRTYDSDGRLVSDAAFVDAGPGLCAECGQPADLRGLGARHGERDFVYWTTYEAVCVLCALQAIDDGVDVAHPSRWPTEAPAPRDTTQFLPPDRPIRSVSMQHGEWVEKVSTSGPRRPSSGS